MDSKTPSPVHPFWTDPEQVESFANRDPDVRLAELLDRYSNPASTRVLDLGCAGGRNTVLLAARRFDVFAVDASRPMLAKTRSRIAEISGVSFARERITFGVMEDLSNFPDSSFDIIVALGVYHQASKKAKWINAVEESARVAKDGALVLISAFTPNSQPDGEPLKKVSNETDVYDGFSSGPMYLLDVEQHDAQMDAFGFLPDVPTETVRVETELGYRTTMNALYRKAERGLE